MTPWFLYTRTCDASRPEQTLLSLCSVLRRDQAQMRPGSGGRDPAARRPGQQSFPYEEGLGDLLDGLPLLPHGDRQGGQADRAAAEELQQRAEDGTVQPIESAGVNLVHLEGGRGDLPVDRSFRLDLGVVADPAQQPVGDTGVPRERPAISAAPSTSISTSRRRAERWMTRSSSAGA